MSTFNQKKSTEIIRLLKNKKKDVDGAFLSQKTSKQQKMNGLRTI